MFNWFAVATIARSYLVPWHVAGVRFCCKQLPAELLTSSNEALIIFQSNMSGIDYADRRGFQLGYSIRILLSLSISLFQT